MLPHEHRQLEQEVMCYPTSTASVMCYPTSTAGMNRKCSSSSSSCWYSTWPTQRAWLHPPCSCRVGPAGWALTLAAGEAHLSQRAWPTPVRHSCIRGLCGQCVFVACASFLYSWPSAGAWIQECCPGVGHVCQWAPSHPGCGGASVQWPSRWSASMWRW